MMARVRTKAALAALGLGLLAGTDALAEAGWYSGIAGGISMLDMGSKRAADDALFGGLVDSSSLDDTYGGFSLHVGYRWNSYVGTELAYLDLGEGVYEASVSNPAITSVPFDYSARFSSSGIAVSMLGMLPLGEGRFDLHGRAGVLYADTRNRGRLLDQDTGEVLLSAEVKANSWDLFAGLGAAWNINDSFSLRVEYQRFFDVGDDEETGELDIDLLSIGVLFR